jgi:uncharacterized protein with PIN domain
VVAVDASVLAAVVADAGRDGRRLRHQLRGEVVAVTELPRLEAVSVIRRHLARGKLEPEQGERTVDALLELPLAV